VQQGPTVMPSRCLGNWIAVSKRWPRSLLLAGGNWCGCRALMWRWPLAPLKTVPCRSAVPEGRPVGSERQLARTEPLGGLEHLAHHWHRS
jgi:hypothetical protein